MTVNRRIGKILRSRATREGAGVHLKRGFGFHEVPQLDPFLLLDDFHSGNPAEYLPGFPWHPHRGIETITYVLNGEVDHGDSMGNSGVIRSGDVQWMTAGSGIIHQEMPRGDEQNRLWGFQLWANLPASQKMMEPRYREVEGRQIPEIPLPEGARARIICGKINDVQGPVQDIVTDPEYVDISIPANSSFRHPVKAGYTVFTYVTEGKAYFDEERNAYKHDVVGAGYFDFKRECQIGPENVVLYEREGDHILVTTKESAVRFLLVAGKPLGEPVAWYGPIVMNTQEELEVAFEEYRKGTFLKHD